MLWYNIILYSIIYFNSIIIIYSSSSSNSNSNGSNSNGSIIIIGLNCSILFTATLKKD